MIRYLSVLMCYKSFVSAQPRLCKPRTYGHAICTQYSRTQSGENSKHPQLLQYDNCAKLTIFLKTLDIFNTEIPKQHVRLHYV